MSSLAPISGVIYGKYNNYTSPNNIPSSPRGGESVATITPLESDAVYGKIPPALIVVERDYNILKNKPSIEGVELIGDKTFAQLGLTPMTSLQIDFIVNLLT